MPRASLQLWIPFDEAALWHSVRKIGEALKPAVNRQHGAACQAAFRANPAGGKESHLRGQQALILYDERRLFKCPARRLSGSSSRAPS